ncbi:cation:proton antiporter family protein [Modicisalibacter tunisiensis]|uniref:Cation:proton antiporter n=1 Tax=Modicisalibacter tunisiensis TaxID=390637 RepID=A0ABS7X225_9GAMM|nr:cation:proton antiporter family protein [Modicisalibacter tunisiensis]MBZ9537630.1 cation:proton antiporter [Modicisalibacter tunisiensis]MBZ9568952.1 cation:proton antiporter [Modicisalibacter tunisiensis]
MLEVICLTVAFMLGLLAWRCGLPALIGFLAAGFLINPFAEHLALPASTPAILDHVSHLGVLLLLFTVGLKLKLRSLGQPEVLGGGLIHFIATLAVFAPGLHWLGGIPWPTAELLAVALAFSSTVLSAKSLEARRELRAFHGRVAIGILIIQDLIALVVLAFSTGQVPSPWALCLLGLPLLRPLFYRLIDWSGHDELLLLMGLVLAVVIGGAGFTALGLSGEVGALLLGALVAGHPRAQELGKSLWALKELFLVGFFLKIGMSGLPDWQSLGFALAFTALLPLKAALFFFLLILFRLRARNAFQAAISLTSYSEFGLIVAAALVPDALVSLALAVALSFLVAAPLQRNAHALFARFEPFLRRFEKDHWHPDEQPASLGEARVMIVGMGRTGTAAYDRLHADHTYLIGLDADPSRVESHVRDGRHVVYADVEDVGFWNSVELRHVEVVVLSLPDAETKIFATRQLRAHGFTGAIVAHSLYEDEAEAIRQAGANQTYLTMHEAGLGLAEHVRQGLHVAATR